MSSPNNNIALIGYRGTGKSTVGRILAAQLGYAFLDTDSEIESTSGRSISDIFSKSGESSFRDLEEQAIANLAGAHDTVVSTGGGAILREANRVRLKACGTVIWLTASLPVIADRIGIDPSSANRRPSLTKLHGLDEIRHVLEKRRPLYASLAQFTVDTDGTSPAKLAELIVRYMSKSD